VRRARPNKTIVEPARQVPVFAETDVLVVGGGPAGTAAAIAAARLGADVLLVERYNHLGGLATGGLVIWIDRMTDWFVEWQLFRRLGHDNRPVGRHARLRSGVTALNRSQAPYFEFFTRVAEHR
jgi:flavin-dependent dehydrogenase